MTRVRLMALDPGGVTGAATGVFSPSDSVAGTLKSVRHLEAREFRGDPLRQALAIRLWYRELSPHAIAVESFQLRQRNAELSPIEVTWALRGALGLSGSARIFLQSPSQAKSFATNDRLRAWGWYDLGRGSDHKRDAMRHLALYVARLVGA